MQDAKRKNKLISITLDEETLEILNKLTESKKSRRIRSQVIRQAIKFYYEKKWEKEIKIPV